MGDDMISLGYVVGLDYADATLSAHDLLQQFKTHPFIRELLEGGKRLAWGAKTIPGGGLYGLPSRLHVPGAVLVGDSAGFVDMIALKGVHYAIRSGILAAEPIYEALKAGKATTAGGPVGLRPAHPRLGDLEGPLEGPQHPPRLPEELPLRRHGPRHGHRLDGPRRPSGCGSRPTPRSRSSSATAASSYPKPDGAVHLRQALAASSPAATRPATTSRATSASRPSVPRELAVAWECDVPGEGLRDRRRRAPERHRDGAGSTRRTACSAARSPPRAAA